MVFGTQIYIYIQGLYSIFNINMIVRHQKVLLNPKAGTHWDDAKRIGDLKQQHMGVKNCNSKTGLMITLKSTMPNLQILCIQPERPYIYIHNSIYIHIYIYWHDIRWHQNLSKNLHMLGCSIMMSTSHGGYNYNLQNKNQDGKQPKIGILSATAPRKNTAKSPTGVNPTTIYPPVFWGGILFNYP